MKLRTGWSIRLESQQRFLNLFGLQTQLRVSPTLEALREAGRHPCSRVPGKDVCLTSSAAVLCSALMLCQELFVLVLCRQPARRASTEEREIGSSQGAALTHRECQLETVC